ncbi:MAG: SHOCT domain-containing protein [bacterium]
MKKSINLRLLILLILLISSSCFAKSTKPKLVVFNLQYTFSQEPPSSIEREIVPKLEELAHKHIVKLGKKLQKKYKVQIIDNIAENKLGFVNALLILDNIHGEYEHNTYTDDYFARVKLAIFIKTPDNNTTFERIYLSDGKLHFSKQWSEWIGINKITDFTIDKLFKKILEDKELGETLKTIDKDSFFDINSLHRQAAEDNNDLKEEVHQPEPKTPDLPKTIPPSIEERLKTLENLKEKGLITEEEFQEKRIKILDGI